MSVTDLYALHSARIISRKYMENVSPAAQRYMTGTRRTT